MTGNKTLKNKGFTMPELLAVMAIMAILAAVSSPFIRGYIRDAGNEKAKSTLRIISMGYKNFMYEHQTRSNGLSISGKLYTNDATCPEEEIEGTVEPAVLIGCHYIPNISWDAYANKYEFYIGQCCTDAPANAWACMKGLASEGDYTSSYCAWVEEDGTLKDNKQVEEQG